MNANDEKCARALFPRDAVAMVHFPVARAVLKSACTPERSRVIAVSSDKADLPPPITVAEAGSFTPNRFYKQTTCKKG